MGQAAAATQVGLLREATDKAENGGRLLQQGGKWPKEHVVSTWRIDEVREMCRPRCRHKATSLVEPKEPLAGGDYRA